MFAHISVFRCILKFFCSFSAEDGPTAVLEMWINEEKCKFLEARRRWKDSKCAAIVFLSKLS